MKENNNSLLFKYVSESNPWTRAFIGALLFVVGTVCLIVPIVEEEYFGYFALTALGYFIGIPLFFSSFNFCRGFYISYDSISISKGFATDLEFPIDSVVGFGMNSYTHTVTVATAAGTFKASLNEESADSCFKAIKMAVYARQRASSDSETAPNRAPSFAEELPDL